MNTLPLRNICELEPASDVVCDDGYKSLIHDETFNAFLKGYVGDFEEASKIERPMVSLKVLESWRQDRNGRFVKHDEDRNLWNDIGDKKSREYISKALKQISKSSSNSSDQADKQAHERTISSTSENTAATETSSQSSNLKSSTLMGVATTPFSSPDDINRRVSASIVQPSRKADHLYGRAQEQSNLVALYDQSLSLDDLTNFLILSGESGTGKTALGLSLRRTVVQSNGFFAQAKFEQLEIDDSLAAYISVFSDFCQSIVDMKDYKLQKLHVEKISSLMEHLLDDTIAVSIVPALGEILSLASKLSPNNQNKESPSGREEISQEGNDEKQRVPVHVSYSSARLKFCFSKILKSIVCNEYPLVVLLDDVQYASSTVSFRDFLADLVDHQGLFFIATYRIGLGPSALSFEELTTSLNQDVINLHHWELNGLTPQAVHELMADTLSSDLPRLENLSSDLFYLTGGNVLFILELLRSFQDDGILKYDTESGQWICDNHLLSHHPSMQVHSLDELYQTKIAELPQPVQDTLKIAAVLGPSSSIDIVNRVSKHTQVADAFAIAIKAGLVTNISDAIVSFRHDSIHTAAYNLIPDDEKSMFALTLGRRLWRRAGEKNMNKYTADVVGLMYRGRDELIVKSSPTDLAAVALLCLQASKLAGKSRGFHSSIFFVDFGIDLLEHAGKWKDNYDLCISLHNNAVDVHYGVGQFGKVEELVDEVLKNARCFGDTVQARMMKVYTLGTRKKLVEALDYGIETLALLHDPIPAFPTNVQVALAITRTKSRLKGKSDPSLLRIPTLTDQKKIEVMMALQIMFLNAYFARPSLAVLICCRIIDITLEHGACAVSSVGFAGYAVVAARGGINFEESYKFGQNALAFAQKFGGDVWKCRAAAAVYGCINIWKEPLLPCLSEMKKAYLLGLGSGDIEYAVLNASLYIWNCFGYMPLDQLELSIRTLFERMAVLQQTGSLLTLKPVWQMCQNFLGRNHNPKYLLGEALTREDLADSAGIDNYYEVRSSIGADEMVMAYHFSDYAMAEARLPSAIAMYNSVSTVSAANARMYHALILLETAKRSNWSRIRKVKRLLKQMRRWSKSCPENYLGIQLLVEAELARVQKKKQIAYSKFYLAIIQFRDAGCLLYEALANERAGKFCVSIGDKDKGNKFLKESLKVYKAWGALAKCEHLKLEMERSIMCLTCNN